MVYIIIRRRNRRPQACRIKTFISFGRNESHRVWIERVFAPKTECRKFLKNMNLFVFFSSFVLIT